MKFYVKATGDNRWAGGSCQWLLIRGIEKTKEGYHIKVKTKWGIKWIGFGGLSENPKYLIFKNELNGFENFKSILIKYAKN